MRTRTTITITNDSTTKQLHQQFFNDDSTTDTMSFPFNEVTPEGEYFVGDIVVNFDQLKRQAEELSVPQKEELARLITHSALHLLGFDDDTEEASGQMKKSENNVLAKIFKNFTPRR
jgi:probable rRNA maturation factor